jgi:hypothetical protein
MIAERVDQELPATIELTAEYSMWTVRLVEGSARVLDGCTKVPCRMLVLEAFDSISLGTREQKTDHHIVEATVDEIVDDHAQFRFPAELFEQAHLVEGP